MEDRTEQSFVITTGRAIRSSVEDERLFFDGCARANTVLSLSPHNGGVELYYLRATNERNRCRYLSPALNSRHLFRRRRFPPYYVLSQNMISTELRIWPIAQSVWWLALGLDDRDSITGRSRDFSLRHRIQTGSGIHPTSFPLGRVLSFLGGKVTGAWSWPLTSI
jgi:hypothetical protein